MSDLDFDELLKNYKQAVGAWIEAIRAEVPAVKYQDLAGN